MPAERKLEPHEVIAIFNWGKRWRAMRTLKQTASKYGISESTVRRIIDAGGYAEPKERADIDALARRCDSFSSVPRGTEEDNCAITR